MRKCVLSLAMALMLTITLAVPTFAAGKTEKIFGDVSVTNVTSWSEGCDEAVLGNWGDVALSEELWLYTTRVYCDSAPVTITIENPGAGGGDFYTGVGGMEWAWDGDVKTEPTNSFVETGDGRYYGSLVLNDPGVYLFKYSSGQFAGGEMFAGDSNGFCIIVGGDSTSVQPTPTPTPIPETPTPTPIPETPTLTTPASTTPAPTTPASTTPTPTTPAPSTTVTGTTAALKTTDGLVSVIPPAPVRDNDLVYTVQKGETLWGIAYNYYGSMSVSAVSKIKSANAEYFKKTKGILEAGAVITLPTKGLINPVTQSSLDNAAGVYLVKSGDTLADIAKVYYGDAKQWTKIYESNKDRVTMVGKSPMIYENQWLVIPE